VKDYPKDNSINYLLIHL